MMHPIQITFRNMQSSQTVEGWVQKEAEKLEEFYNRITSCRVVVELPNKRRRFGSLYNVRIDITVPGGELVVNRQPNLRSKIIAGEEKKVPKQLEIQAPHKELRQAINDAFNEMSRRLQDFARRQRGDVKAREASPRAKISKLFPEDGYGFLEAPDGREIYFHKNSLVRGGFDGLNLGATVRFSEEEGAKGPQASKVSLVRARTSSKKVNLPVTVAQGE